MWGISYGAFTAIQVAKLRPPHLLAIVPFQGTDDRYLTDVHYIGGCVTASELSQYARQPGRDERDAARRGVPRRRLARRVAGAARGDAAVAHRLAAPPDRRAVLATGLAGARLRRDRGADLQRRAAGATPTSMRPSGCRRAARRRRGRSSATGSTAGRTTRNPARTSTSSTRSSGSSIAGSRASATASTTSRRSSGSSATTAAPEPFPETWPGRWRAAAAYPAPGRRRCASGGSTAATLPLQVGRLVDGEADRLTDGVDTFVHRPTIGTRAALSWGAGGLPNGLARDLRPDESLGPDLHQRPARRTDLDPRRTGRRPAPRGRRPRSRPPSSGSPMSPRTGRRRRSVPAS